MVSPSTVASGDPVLPHELPALRVVCAEEQPVAPLRRFPFLDEDAIVVQHDRRRRVVASGDIDEILPGGSRPVLAS